MATWLRALLHRAHWRYGQCDRSRARRSRLSGKIYFRIELGEDKVEWWAPLHRNWWPEFKPDKS